MADLDIFFAKKDKKKVKGRKYDDLDEIAKRLKESEKRVEKERIKVEPHKKTLDEVLSSSTVPEVKLPGEDGSILPEPKLEKTHKQDEEEWNDFRDEAQKDLTNLKISKLQIEDDEDGFCGYGSGEDEGGSGSGSKSEGVWSKNIERLENEQQAAEPEPMPTPASKDKRASSYIAPHLRNSSAGSSPASRASNRKPKTAPDITNAMAFPSLSDAQTTAPAGSPWGRKKLIEDRGFESVKHGSTKNYTDNHAPQKVSTANRFDALSDNS